MSGLSSRPDCSGPAITRPVRHFYYSLISFRLAARLLESTASLPTKFFLPQRHRARRVRRQVWFNNNSPSLGFLTSVHSKGVKVLCFDTVLQVLILNEIEGVRESTKSGMRVGLPALFCARNREMPSEGMPPPVFCKKSPQAIENKGWGSEKERQEISRVRKLLRN